MATTKTIANLGVAWEQTFGYAQAVQVKDTIYISGQLSHDGDGKMVAPATLDAQGRPVDFEPMEAQIRQSYVNAKSFFLSSVPLSTTLSKRRFLSSTSRVHSQPDQRSARRCTARTLRPSQAT